MGKNILSQDEVDALLGAVDSGELDEDQSNDKENDGSQGNVKDYNFKRPNLVTREQLRGLNDIHSDFARELQSNLSIFLRTNVDVNLVSAEQQQYSEFILSLSDISHLALFKLSPLPGVAVLELNLSLVFGMVDLLLGGEGDIESTIRTLTDVEAAVLEPLTQMFFDKLQQSLSAIMDVDVLKERYESSPEYVQAAPSDAPVVVLTFDAKVGLANGIINICYPLPMVQVLVKELAGRAGNLDNYYGKSEAVDFRRQIIATLLEIPLKATVDLGNAFISTGDWQKVKKGDILVLDHMINEKLTVRIGNSPCFFAFPGKSRRNVAVKLCGEFKAVDESQIDGLIGPDESAKAINEFEEILNQVNNP